MRNAQCAPISRKLLFAAILHDAGATDHLEIGDLCQLCQNVVLDAIGKERVLFMVAEIFKWQHSDSSRYRLPDQFTLPNDPTTCGCQASTRDAANSAMVGLRRTHFLPRLNTPVRRA